MCGRFACITNPSKLARFLALPSVPGDLKPRYNITPSQHIPVVRHTASGERRLHHLTWGLIPSWARDPAIGQKLINARAETISSKPSFRNAFSRRRCLVIADGFFEWKHTPSGKQPFYVRLKSGDPMAFAAIWERWSSTDGATVDSCAIITTRANALVSQIHDRMPVLLPPAAFERWLSRSKPPREELLALLAPCPNEDLLAVPVSRAVNTPSNEGPQCVEPVGEPLVQSPTTKGKSI